MARCFSTVGEPHSEILHAPHLFFNIKLKSAYNSIIIGPRGLGW